MSWLPTADEHGALLRPLVGRWLRQEPSTNGTPSRRRGIVRAGPRLADFFVMADYVEEEDGLVVLEGHGVLGWDAEQRAYTWHWFDSLGFAAREVARGMRHGNTLTFQQTSARETARFTHVFSGADAYEFSMHLRDRDGGRWRPFLEGRYLRVAEAELAPAS